MNFVVFDFDGTLVDSRALILECYHRVFSEFGIPLPSPEDIMALIGKSLDLILAELAGPGAPIAEMARAYQRVLPRVRENALFAERPFTGIVELLNDLSLTSNIVLGIATGHTSAGVEPALETLGWRQLFVTIQTSDMAPSKPHPGMLIRAMEATGTKPESAVFIGDTTFDMEMAKAAELPSIGVSWGHHKTERLLAAGAERIARDARELRLHIQDVVKERG